MTPLRTSQTLILMILPALWIVSSCTGCSLIGGAVELAEQIPPKSRVVVIGIYDLHTKELAYEDVTELLINNLVTSSKGKFDVYERRLIKDVLKELNFQMSDLADQQKAAQIGKFLGANVVISGTQLRKTTTPYVSPLFSIRAIDVESLKILAVTTGSNDWMVSVRLQPIWPR